jgi:hypothetical protein
MRTRRSPKNQEKLFRELFKPPSERPEEGPAQPMCFNCANYPRGGRSGCKCRLTGTRMNGTETRPECFRPRSI